MAKAKIHTPGKHEATLDHVDIKVSPSRGHHMVRLRFRHLMEPLGATLYQSILWANPDKEGETPDIGAHILSKVFSKASAGSVERNASFWHRMDVNEAVRYIGRYVGCAFSIEVHERTNRDTNETYPIVKYAYYEPNK